MGLSAGVVDVIITQAQPDTWPGKHYFLNLSLTSRRASVYISVPLFTSCQMLGGGVEWGGVCVCGGGGGGLFCFGFLFGAFTSVV